MAPIVPNTKPIKVAVNIQINRVIDYIQANLGAPLPIVQLAKVACYSEFHFNRIFKKQMGESVYQFIRRLRLEKAAERLLMEPETSITEIALDCGFSTPSSFAKSFACYFRMNATAWRNQAESLFDEKSQPLQIEQGKITFPKGSPAWTFQNEGSIRQVVIENITPLKIAYVRNVGPYQGDDTLFDKLYAQLFQWAVPRGYVSEETYILNLYHDNPVITDNKKLRVMAAIPVHEDACPSEFIGVTGMSGGKYGVCRFLLNKSQFSDAWNWMFSVWLDKSGYEKDDRETFERCREEKFIAGERFFDVDICVPVKIARLDKY